MKRLRRAVRYHFLAERPTPTARPPRPRSHPTRRARRRPPMIGEDVMVPSTENDQLRQQLLQAQRMSSVGALASSVAHEFNNILTTIINYAKLALKPEADEATRT